MSKKDIPAWMAAGKSEAGAIASSQVKAGNPDVDPKVAAVSDPVVAVTQEPSVSTDKKVKVARRANVRKPKAASASVAQAPAVVSDPVIAPAPSQEEIDYTSGGVFAEQILAEQDAVKDISLKAEEIHQVKPEKERIQPIDAELAAVKNFDELFAVLDKYDGIQGSEQFFTSEELKRRVELVRNGKEFLKALTGGADFRETVRRLLDEERIASEKTDKAEAEQPTEKKERAKKKEQTPEEIEITRIESEMKELYHTMIDEKSGKTIESGKLVDARKAYAEAEYRNVGVWQRLTEKLGVRKKESDSVAERGKYNQVLQKLITLRIEKLKNQGLSPEDLKKAMAEELQFFGMESKVKLYEAWTQATMKRESFPAKAVGLCEDLGNKYNKLPLWQKLGLGALAIGASVATGGGAAAMGLVAARRVAAGLGTFAMMEGVLEKISQGRASNVVKNKADQSIAEMKDGNAEKQLKQLMKTLKGEMSKENLRQELHDRAKGKSLRTITAAAVSFGAMFGIPAAANHIKEVYFGTEVVEKVGSAVKNSVAAVVDQKITSSGGVAPAIAEKIPSGPVIQEHVQELMKDPARLETLKVLDEAKALREMPAVYEIVKGDTTWRLLDGYLTDHDITFAGMSEGQRTYAIDALKDKLKLLTPAQLKEAGFTSGNIDKLRVGDTIDLDKLLGTVDADKAISSADAIGADAVQNIEANNVKIAEWAKAHPGVAINDAVIENQILHLNPSVSGMDAHGVRTMYQNAMSQSSDPTWNRVSVAPAEAAPSPAEAPLDRISPVEMRRGSDWFMQIFRVEDQVSGKDWIFDKKEILGTKMSDILKVEANGTVSVKENVNFSLAQSKNLQEFTSELPKAFPGGRAALGDFLRARPNISVGEYIARVAKVVPQGTRIGLYTTTN